MTVLSRYLAGLLAGFSCCTLASTASAAQPTHEYVLANGLKVIVREDHRAPVVVSQLWYKVGSTYEGPGQTGLSHVLEHMMFKGSSKLGPGESSRVLRDLGAEENAFTSDDYTAFYQVLARDRLPVALEMEADRMATLTLPESEFTREIEVIKEERRLRTDDKPSQKAFELFKAAAYPSSSYRTPTIGWMADLQRTSVQDARDWYRTWYAPNNATLVVVGDVQPEAVKAMAERFFGPIPQRPVPVAKRPVELAEPGERRLVLPVRTRLPSLLMAFNVPSAATAADARSVQALRLTVALLDGGYSARMASRLERGSEVVSAASASYDAYERGDSLFTLSATPNSEKHKTLADTEKAMWALLDDLKRTPPTAEELERVRAQFIAGLVYDRDSITSQATAIGQLETVGLPWTLLDGEVEALSQVTPEDIRQAARTYFTHSRLTVAHVLPEAAPHD